MKLSIDYGRPEPDLSSELSRERVSHLNIRKFILGTDSLAVIGQDFVTLYNWLAPRVDAIQTILDAQSPSEPSEQESSPSANEQSR